MLGPLARISHQFGRNVMQTAIRNGSHGGVPGENLPFNIHNRARVTFIFLLYGLTGFAAPFLVVVHQLKKK